MTARPHIVLASGSAIRAKILHDAGVDFTAVKPGVDEAAVKQELAGSPLPDIAMALAERKSLSVEAPGALIIGSDQILEFRGKAFDKPADMAEAHARLAALAGETHSLINATAVACDGEIVFRHLAQPTLKMRAFSDEEIARYLAAAGEGVLASVGAYQVEGLGAHLFEAIAGDYFAVLGLALFPLLGFLREQGAGPF